MLQSFRRALASMQRSDGLPCAALLPEELILHVLGPARALFQGWVYLPAVTVWMFVSQCLSSDHSCLKTVARLIAWRLAHGQRKCSAETGAYCTARSKLPEEACQELVRRTGAELEEQSPTDWLWHGRRVRVVDGTTVTMADTPANQAAYPQLKGQRKGCGFPIARVLVVFSLAVGTVLELAISRYTGKLTGENSLFRQLHDKLSAGDVVLADRYFSGWFDMALLYTRGIDVVVRKHQMRATDFRTGIRLGPDDHWVGYRKPQRPAWMSSREWEALPEWLELREVRVRVTRRGFRTQRLVVVTTLLDAEQYSADAIASLYRRRWDAELHLRSLKVVLQMDYLRRKTPEAVRNELRMHLLGYNLIRRVMALSAQAAGLKPWQISFKGALQTISSFLPMLAGRMPIDEWIDGLLTAVATHEVGDRPDRYEPRLTKRRPKKYKHLREPRDNYRKRLARKS